MINLQTIQSKLKKNQLNPHNVKLLKIVNEQINKINNKPPLIKMKVNKSLKIHHKNNISGTYELYVQAFNLITIYVDTIHREQLSTSATEIAIDNFTRNVEYHIIAHGILTVLPMLCYGRYNGLCNPQTTYDKIGKLGNSLYYKLTSIGRQIRIKEEKVKVRKLNKNGEYICDNPVKDSIPVEFLKLVSHIYDREFYREENVWHFRTLPLIIKKTTTIVEFEVKKNVSHTDEAVKYQAYVMTDNKHSVINNNPAMLIEGINGLPINNRIYIVKDSTINNKWTLYGWFRKYQCSSEHVNVNIEIKEVDDPIFYEVQYLL